MIPQDRQKECPSSLPHSGLLTSQGPPQMYFRSIWKTFPSYGGNDFRLYPFPSALLHCPALSSDYSLSLGRTWLKSPRQEMNPDESQSFSEVAHGLDAAAQNAVQFNGEEPRRYVACLRNVLIWGTPPQHPLSAPKLLSVVVSCASTTRSIQAVVPDSSCPVSESLVQDRLGVKHAYSPGTSGAQGRSSYLRPV
eukprot:XP_017167943.1 PREDICTED: uncharacterized protein B230311B06Rik isoform X2 [Mus musculus]